MEENKTTEEVPVASPEAAKPVTTVALVRNRDGGFREVAKDSKGKFIKKVNRNEVNEDQQRSLGKRFMKTGEKWLGVYKNLYRIATKEDEGENAPKSDMAAVKAAELLRLLLYGKVSMSEADKEALQENPIRTVIITNPNVPMGKDHTTIEKPTQPSWVDAEVVSTNTAPPKGE